MLADVTAVLGTLSVVLWAGLLLLRGWFWRADQRLDEAVADGRRDWPRVVAVIAARNEAPTIALAVDSLLKQDYPGDFRVVLVDDNSDDGTAEKGRAAGGDSGRLGVVAGSPLEPGWTGKLWALDQGLEEAERVSPEATYILLTDADIAHDPENLRRLVAKAENHRLDLVSLMVLLHCESPWEHLLHPAFVFFFQKLYPFPWVNDPDRPDAAAAGGCMLVRRTALERAGGVGSIRGRLIDDCALAERIKRSGPIWLGLAEKVHSLRAHDRLQGIWKMVARTAFAQLNQSTLALIGTVIGMALLYLTPPAVTLAGAAIGETAAALSGLAAWLLMAVAYRPTSRLYGQPGWLVLLLPLAALLFTLMTVDSARRHWRKRGGSWKGRSYKFPFG